MSNSPAKVLLLFAHPSLDRSEVNASLLRASRKVESVTVVDLYGEYPDYRIDIEREQQRLRDHDALVFMFPLYWYSTPAILKEWQDLVLEYGFAYGEDGDALHGKLFMCAITAGGSESAYRAEGYNHFTLRELLTPLEQTANLIGMQFLPPYALSGARTVLEARRAERHVADWVRVLTALRDGVLDTDRARSLRKLKDDLPAVLGGAL